MNIYNLSYYLSSVAFLGETGDASLESELCYCWHSVRVIFIINRGDVGILNFSYD